MSAASEGGSLPDANQTADASRDNRPEVSIVVASHRPEYIGRLLEGLGPAATDPHTVEIIVVHDYPVQGESNGTVGVRWIHHPDRSIPAKRNRGIAASLAPVVAFIDDDCRPAPGWVAAAMSYLAGRPDCAAVEGRTTIAPAEGASGSYGEYKRLEKQGYRTNNIFYRKAVLERVGGFDERFTVQREDLDLAFSVMDAGGGIGYAVDAVVEHAHRGGESWDLLKNCVNRRFDPLLYRKHRQRYRQHVGSPFTPSIALMLAMHLATLIACAVSLRFGAVAAVLDLFAAFAIALRKHVSSRSVRPVQLAREVAAFAAGPAVLTGALIYGSIRFRRFLLF